MLLIFVQSFPERGKCSSHCMRVLYLYLASKLVMVSVESPSWSCLYVQLTKGEHVQPLDEWLQQVTKTTRFLFYIIYHWFRDWNGQKWSVKFSVSGCIENTNIVSRTQNTSGEKHKLIIDMQFGAWIERFNALIFICMGLRHKVRSLPNPFWFEELRTRWAHDNCQNWIEHFWLYFIHSLFLCHIDMQ